MKHLELWLVGGDRRQSALARLLAEDGHRVHTCLLGNPPPDTIPETDLSGIETAHAVILGLPALIGDYIRAPTADETLPLSELLAALRPGQLLCGGQLSPALTAAAEARQIVTADYFQREELAVANAVPTSEGAIQIAMEELPVTLHNARALVIGAGRIGKVLCRQLTGLGAKVTLCARKYADLAWAEVAGCEPLHTEELSSRISGFDVIFNTAPALLLTRAVLERLDPPCPVIDLASKPGGTDFAAAEELGIKAIHALALPGKVAPLTAARAIQTALSHIFSEQGA